MDLDITADQHDLLTLCALRTGDTTLDWSLLARSAQSPEGLAALMDGQLHEDSRAATKYRPLLRQAPPPASTMPVPASTTSSPRRARPARAWSPSWTRTTRRTSG